MLVRNLNLTPLRDCNLCILFLNPNRYHSYIAGGMRVNKTVIRGRFFLDFLGLIFLGQHYSTKTHSTPLCAALKDTLMANLIKRK